MEQNKYQYSDKLPLSLVVEELEKDAEFTDKALQILSVEDRGSTHTPMTAVSALINHWLVNRDLNCYINGKLVDDVTALTVLPVDGDYGAGIEALENWMTICKDELAALLEQRNLSVTAFLRPSVKVSKAPPPGDDWKENAKQIGKRIYKEKPLFSVDKIAEKTHKEMTARKANGESGMTGRGGNVPLADTIKRHALTGIKS